MRRTIDDWFSGTPVAKTLLCASICGALLSASALAQSEETISKALLVGMANSQYSVLCNSKAFTQCMGFTDAACADLADEAIQQCLLPLPEEIDPATLDNSALESCPRRVFEQAGFTEVKAALCFDEAMAESSAAPGASPAGSSSPEDSSTKDDDDDTNTVNSD